MYQQLICFDLTICHDIVELLADVRVSRPFAWVNDSRGSTLKPIETDGPCWRRRIFDPGCRDSLTQPHRPPYQAAKWISQVSSGSIKVCAMSEFRFGANKTLKNNSKQFNAHQAFGGATRSRTGLIGFAIRCITALLSRQNSSVAVLPPCGANTDEKGKPRLPFLWSLEREKSLELSTSTLARLRSTN